MINLIIDSDNVNKIRISLKRAGKSEIGGILMAEHVGVNEFLIREITVHKKGAFASFIRKIEDVAGTLHAFFKNNEHRYNRFNYIGEWHSHPSFELSPSHKDNSSMLEIIQDESVGANFVVLVIVKLDGSGRLLCSAHTYLPDGVRHRGIISYR